MRSSMVMGGGSCGGKMVTCKKRAVELTSLAASTSSKAAIGINTHIDFALPAYPVGWHMEWRGGGRGLHAQG